MKTVLFLYSDSISFCFTSARRIHCHCLKPPTGKRRRKEKRIYFRIPSGRFIPLYAHLFLSSYEFSPSPKKRREREEISAQCHPPPPPPPRKREKEGTEYVSQFFLVSPFAEGRQGFHQMFWDPTLPNTLRDCFSINIFFSISKKPLVNLVILSTSPRPFCQPHGSMAKEKNREEKATTTTFTKKLRGRGKSHSSDRRSFKRSGGKKVRFSALIPSPTRTTKENGGEKRKEKL